MESWAYESARVDFFDLKGHLQDIFTAFELNNIRLISSSHPMLCPGVSAEIRLGKTKIGMIGMLSPELSTDIKLEQDPFLFELNYDSLKTQQSKNYIHKEYHPSSRRDLSLLISNEIEVDQILNEINNLKFKELRETVVFDLFTKKDGERTQNSVSIGLIFQANSRTLRDNEIDDFMLKVIKMLKTNFKISIKK